jgi:RND family efflux transporter MFP subunit
MNKILTHLVFPVVIVAAGAAGAATLVRSAQGAEAKSPIPQVPRVQTQTVAAAAYSTRVEANGVVEATRALTVLPEVGGKLVYVSDSLVEGGRVEKGEVLVRIDSSAYRIALAQAKAELARAKADLELEAGRGRSATREWERFGKKGEGNSGHLATRGPQLASAQALVDLRQAAVDKARLDLGRASIKAPFDAIVQSEQVEKGQVVSPGVSLASLVASEEMWVRAPLRLESLGALHLASDGAPGSRVRMRLDTGRGQATMLTGEALRLGAEIDTDTRKAELIIRVKPEDNTSQVPLLPGAFLTLELESPKSKQALQIPRDALVEGGRIWVVDSEERLRRIELDVAWTDRDAVYVLAEGLPAPWQGKSLSVVRRPYAGALEGVQVRSESFTEQAPAVADSGSQGASIKAAREEVDHG